MIKSFLHRAQKQCRLGIVGGIGISVLGFLLVALPFGEPLRNFSYDLPFILRPSTIPPKAAIIAIDDTSVRSLGQLPDVRAWKRSLHANLLRRSALIHARAVVFDVVFD